MSSVAAINKALLGDPPWHALPAAQACVRTDINQAPATRGAVP